MSTSPNLKSNIKLRSGVSVTSITGKGLYKSFGEGEMRTTAVNDVSIDIKQGEVALMMGPSGSGKTTLLAILSGLLKPDAGKVTALGQDMWALTEREREHFRLKHCSFIFQGYNLFSSLTARQQLEIVAQWGDGASSREARNHADENPDFCFADEPTSALDWAHGEQVIDILRSAAHDRGCTVLIVAHDARVIPYADKIFYLEDGKMVDDGGKSIHKTYGKTPS